MKKITQWFNNLNTQQQRYALLGFCLLFAALLVASIRWERVNMSIKNSLPANIGRSSGELKLKK